MTPLIKLIPAAIATAALLAPAALASDRPGDVFKAMDSDGDTIVTQTEYVDHASTRAGLDPEGARLRFEVLAGLDGELTEAEYVEAMAVLAPPVGIDATAMPGNETR